MTEQKDKQKQRQREEQKKRSLHKKHKKRRKRDVVPNLPFIIGFQADPARPFYCNDENQRDAHGNPTYELIPRQKRSFSLMGLYRLKRYFNHKMTRMLRGKMLVWNAR